MKDVKQNMDKIETERDAGSIFVFSIAARNYLSQVSVLFDSVRKQCGDIEFCCFVVDGFDDITEIPETLRNNVFDCRKLGVPGFEDMAFKYDVVEFSTALKPFIFKHIYESKKYSNTVYFDPDIKLYNNLDWLEDKLESKSILLTPHLLDFKANRLNLAAKVPALDLNAFLYAGTFNLGFIAIKNDSDGMNFIEWWAEVLRDECLLDSTRALCVDQKWADFLSSFFVEHLEILRDAGANLAYWNLHERGLTRDQKSNYFVNGSSLKFVHYSSIDLADENEISAGMRQKNINLTAYPEYKELFSTYKSELLQAGYAERKLNAPYRYNYFEDGLMIIKLHRRIYARLVSEEGEIPNPFSVTGKFYCILKNKKLLESNSTKAHTIPSPNRKRNFNRKRRVMEFVFFILFRLMGTRNYLSLLNGLRIVTDLDENIFLIR